MTDGKVRPEVHGFAPDGTVINSRLPLLAYRQAIRAEAGGSLEEAVIATFRRNDWLNNWTYRGVYDYPHWHSTTHEVLGVVRGEMPLRLGGAGGKEMTFAAGDVIVMPAGVSHMSLGGSDDVLMVGGYYEGRDWDLIRDGEHSDAELRAAIKRMMTLPIPLRDPVTGDPMHEWREAPSSLEWGQSVGLSTGIDDIVK